MAASRSGNFKKNIILWAVTTVVVILGVALIMNIASRKDEAQEPYFRVAEINDTIDDPAVWGQNFPLQYDSFNMTTDYERTKFGGSEALPKLSSADDPRTLVAPSRIEEDPRLPLMWDGYAFAIDYREKRGHAYMLEDQTYTKRITERAQPGTCISCHASTVTALNIIGEGDPAIGSLKLAGMSYEDARQHVTQAIACIDCHDPDTMGLRISRPEFKTGIAAYKASQGIPDYNVDTMATQNEMRSFVCAQCHVEYYFDGKSKQLTFPWSNGVLADEILEYYDEIEFQDWTHAKTGAAMLKPQHPEFETWSQGAHAAAGVSCTDCHMPYTRVGAKKITDHHVRSPLLNINRACQVCHKDSEQDILARVESIQSKTAEMSNRTLDSLMSLLDAIEEAKVSGASDDDLIGALQAQRRATWYVDYVEAENSTGFHAPQETARVLHRAMDEITKGHLSLNQSQ